MKIYDENESLEPPKELALKLTKNNIGVFLSFVDRYTGDHVANAIWVSDSNGTVVLEKCRNLRAAVEDEGYSTDMLATDID